MRRAPFALCWLALLVAPAPAQELRIEPLGPLDLELGARTGLRITLTGVDEGELAPLPRIDGLELDASGPNVMRRSLIVNGRVSEARSLSWDVVIEPRRTGTFEIPRLLVRAAGRELQTPQMFKLRVRENTLGAGRVFFELTAEPEQPFLHESVTLRVRFGLVAGLRQGLVDPGWRVHLPVRILAPWLVEFPLGLPSRLDDPQADSSCVLENQQVPLRALGVQRRDGQDFAVYELVQRFYIDRLGAEELAPPALWFQWMDSQAPRDFFGRRAGQARPGFARASAGLRLASRPLPEAGRLTGFSNAVGRFTLSARLAKHRIEVGENVQLVLELGGRGNFEFVRMPELAGVPGFHLYDSEFERRPDAVIGRYDLVALNDQVTELPALALPYFDPETERYATARTAPIPIEVVPLPEGKSLDRLPGERQALVPGADDIFDRLPIEGPPPRRTPPAAALLAIALVAPWLLLGAGLLLARQQGRRRADPARARRARAARRFDARLETDGPLRAFSAYLADLTGRPEGAMLDEELAARLEAEGWAPELAQGAARLVDELTASRYGAGPSEDAGRERARALVARFEEARR